jgi:hypothetical protein
VSSSLIDACVFQTGRNLKIDKTKLSFFNALDTAEVKKYKAIGAFKTILQVKGAAELTFTYLFN